MQQMNADVESGTEQKVQHSGWFFRCKVALVKAYHFVFYRFLSFCIVPVLEKIASSGKHEKTEAKAGKVLLVNSHSLNNQEIFELTWWNHSHYCEKYNYHMLNLIEPYSPKIDCNLTAHLLHRYDLVAYIGSDLLFTNPDIPLEQFAVGDVTLAKEASGSLNGDFMLFRSTPETFEILRGLQLLQRGVDTTQTALNMLWKKYPDNIREVKGLQYADPEMNPAYRDVLWKPGDFVIHFHQYGVAPVRQDKAFYIRQFMQRSEKPYR